jgi:hypothetical protein
MSTWLHGHQCHSRNLLTCCSLPDQALEQNTFRQVSVILSPHHYAMFLAAGSVPEALPYNASDTAHYCYGPMMGLRAGAVETSLEVDSKGFYTGVAALKLTYTYGHNPGAVSVGTIRNECPHMMLVSHECDYHVSRHAVMFTVPLEADTPVTRRRQSRWAAS